MSNTPASLSPVLVEACAEIAHEANRQYCRSMGDESQPLWADAPDWQKDSAREGVVGALNGNTPEQSHESWLAHKAAHGWKYGPVKSSQRLEHPCFVPYEQLPLAQRAKDTLYLAVVRAMAAALGHS